MKCLNLAAIVEWREIPIVAHIPDMTFGHGGVKELDELNLELFKTYARGAARYVVNTRFVRELSDGLMVSFWPQDINLYWGRVSHYIDKVAGGVSVPFVINDDVPDGVVVAMLTT